MGKVSDGFLKEIIFAGILWANSVIALLYSLSCFYWETTPFVRRKSVCSFQFAPILLPGFGMPECFCHMKVRTEIFHHMKAPSHTHVPIREL